MAARRGDRGDRADRADRGGRRYRDDRGIAARAAHDFWRFVRGWVGSGAARWSSGWAARRGPG